MAKDFRNYSKKGIALYKSDFNVNWINQYLGRKPSTIIEFGSYDGGDGAFYKESFPSAKVVSIEACRERYSTIKEYNEVLGIEIYNYAVCDYDGHIDFYPVIDPNVMDNASKYGSSGSINKRTNLYKKRWTHIKEQEPVKTPCIRLDTFCNTHNIENIDFLHVDVEGAEHKVVNGFGDMRPSILWMETHLGKAYYGEDAYEVSELNMSLLAMGYEIKEQFNADTLYIYKK